MINQNFHYILYKSNEYKEGNNRPSSVNQIPVSTVHNHDKSVNKCYTQDNMNIRETQVCE